VVHIAQVIRAGWNNFRSMVTGFEVIAIEEASVAPDCDPIVILAEEAMASAEETSVPPAAEANDE